MEKIQFKSLIRYIFFPAPECFAYELKRGVTHEDSQCKGDTMFYIKYYKNKKDVDDEFEPGCQITEAHFAGTVEYIHSILLLVASHATCWNWASGKKTKTSDT